MVQPKGTWIYFEIEKISIIGGVIIPTAKQIEKEEVEVLAIGPNVKTIKVGQLVILQPKNIISYMDPDKNDEIIRGFVQEENVIAVYKKSK